MDLKNLISGDNDENKSKESQANAELQPELVKRPSQPRLSIHSLMNDNSVPPPSGIEPAGVAIPPPPPPTANTAPELKNPTLEQRMAPFTPTDQNGVVKEELHIQSEPVQPIRALNTTESHDSQIQEKVPDVPNGVMHDAKVDDAPPLPSKAADMEEQTIHEMSQDSELLNDKKIESHSVAEQIQKLEELKNKEEVDLQVDGKPKRYRTKPTWARDYIPTINRSSKSGSVGIQNLKHESLNGSLSKLFTPTITGSIPRNDFNKLVTEWIWANIEGVKQDFFDVPDITKYIELELKLGNIWDKVQDRRIQLPINTECVVATEYVNQDCFFKPGLTLENFNEAKNFLNKIVKENTEQQQQGKGDVKNKIIVENSHVIDLISTDARRNDKPISGRVSLDIKTKRKTNSITKHRVSDLFLHFPNTLYDLRLSLSVELPNELNDAAFETFKKRVSMEREKERISYIHHGTFTRFDLTKVREKSNRIPKYELELEINTPELLRSMENVMDDPLYYIDLIQSFLDNSRILTRHLSTPR